MTSVLWLNLVGLSASQIGEHTPNLSRWASTGSIAPMSGILPGVTCSAQATMLTGTMPREHGAVGNGWLDRKSMEVALWRQSNHLVHGEKVYEAARRKNPSFTCAKLFWWWNMGAAVDFSITPRPYYPADGRKIPAVYSAPPSYGKDLEDGLGPFPFFDFWGPKAGLPSSRWIAKAAIRTLEERKPDLTMAYLPHLDYDHQRFGPDHPRSIQALKDLDNLVGKLLEAAAANKTEVIGVSEYAITEVDAPVHINLALRQAGLLSVRPTPTGEMLDFFASRAFAVTDHQIAHVYCQDEAAIQKARGALENLPGVDQILDRQAQAEFGIDHENAGDLVVVSEARSWFTYYYWSDPDEEPDFARTVDIHRKPGYDPCEMLLDPAIRFPKLKIVGKLLQKKTGYRYRMDLIPLDASLIHGSHGRLPDNPKNGPVYLSTIPFDEGNPAPEGNAIEMTSIKARVLDCLDR
ncbi:MAG: putative AlkP superfamily pyrophosphatase or phosphodiesterase [Planctomycetota bacterium]|jgi:predicted AlkP superfamily pyrophosphatase or phosphodiesterase